MGNKSVNMRKFSTKNSTLEALQETEKTSKEYEKRGIKW